MSASASAKKIWERNKPPYFCAYCQRQVERSLPHSHALRATVDHVIPLSHGGSKLGFHNLVICCYRCNQLKIRIDQEIARVLEFTLNPVAVPGPYIVVDCNRKQRRAKMFAERCEAEAEALKPKEKSNDQA